MEYNIMKSTVRSSIQYLNKLVRITNKDKHLTTESKLMVTMGLLGLQETLLQALAEFGSE